MKVFEQVKDYGYVLMLMVRRGQFRQAVNIYRRRRRTSVRKRRRAIMVLAAWAKRSTTPRNRLDIIRRRR